MAAAEAIAFVVAVLLLPLFGDFAFDATAARLRGSRGLVAGAAASRDGERKKEKDAGDEVDDDESDDTRATTTLDRLTRG